MQTRNTEAAKWNHFRVRNPRVLTFNLCDGDESINGWLGETEVLATGKWSLLFMFLFADDAEIVNGRSGATGINNFHPSSPAHASLHNTAEALQSIICRRKMT